MNVHILLREKFTAGYINFINDNFNAEENIFFLYGNVDEYNEDHIKNKTNVRNIEDAKKEFLITAYTCKRILIHSLSVSNKLLLFLGLQKSMLKKCNWIIWGADLYEYRIPKKTYKEKRRESLRRKVIRNIGAVSTLVKNDYTILKEWYDTDAIHYDARYVDSEKDSYLQKIRNTVTKDSEEVNIIVGNSATKSNRHIEVLNLLSRFKDENIKIYCPLSYGDLEYSKSIQESGNELFGDKFIPLTEFMDMKEYMDFLNKMDVGIFNNDRQQGLGNICALIYLGKKVYLRENTSMKDEMRELMVKTFDIDDIRNQKIEMLSYISEKDRENNYKMIKPIYDTEDSKKLWKRILT